MSYRLLLFFSLIFLTCRAQSYPEFIGYGYSSCLTCHYNGAGGGPLTDYGRALFSNEIASRVFYPLSMSEDDIASQSGFFGAAKLPSWFRPHAKYRGIDVRTNPASGSSDATQFYQMQTDVGLALQDPSARYVAQITYGRVIPSSQFAQGVQALDHIVARDYFVRLPIGKTWWVYGGLMEKVYGLRNVDHTSYQRMFQTFNVQNNTADGVDESQGVVVQKIEKTWEVSANWFFGNPYDGSNYRQKGGSLMSEFEVGENKRLGLSLLSATSPALAKQMAGVHYRQFLNHGSALMFEYGLIQNFPSSSTATTGSYNFVEALVQLFRGYNLKTTVERYNSDFNATSTDRWKWSIGFLMFPAPRFELRAEAVNMRNFSGLAATDDAWALEGQIHVSL